jgi:hypothetical protein
MATPHTLTRRWPSAPTPCRVAIAGTVTNAVTGEVMPMTTLRITEAPKTFGEGLLASLLAAIAQCPVLQANYHDLGQHCGPTTAPLATAQRLLDQFNTSLRLPRPDQTHSGGDGHYCFLDLPPGLYRLSATYTRPNHCHGATTAQVEVTANPRSLTFAQLDLAITLVPGSWSLTVAQQQELTQAPEWSLASSRTP